MQRRELLKNIGFLLFPISLPLPIPLVVKSVLLGVFWITCITYYGSLPKSSSFSKTELNLVFGFLLFFLLEIFTGLLRGDPFYLHDVRLSFFLAPLIYYFAKDAFFNVKKKAMKFFLIGVYLYLLYAIVYVVFFYGFYSERSEFHLDYYLKYVLYNYMPGAIHHTYMGMYMCFSLIVILFSLEITGKNKFILVLPILVLIPFVGSKLSLLIALAIMLFWVFHGKNKRTFKRYIWIVIPLIALNAGLFFFTDLFRTLSVSYGKRMAYFECVLDSNKSQALLGIGNENIKKLMKNCPQTGELMDTHNLLLQEYLTSGLLGIFALAILFISLFLIARRNLLLNLFLIVSLCFGFVEHLFNTQLGVFFFVFFSWLLIDQRDTLGRIAKNQKKG